MQQLIGTNLGQYHLLEVIGSGPAATIYRAYQPSLRRNVAVKVLRPHSSPEFAARFRREAHAVALLQHPHILPIYDSGQAGELNYFVMQLIENGMTLADIIIGQPMEPMQALGLVIPLLDALGYAHHQGIIHRDIKPSNILMFRPDWPLLGDFGIAKSVNESQQLTPPGTAVGTAAYMAPELGRNLGATPRSDLYSMGVMLYEMVTGRVPFEGNTPLAVLMKHVSDRVPLPRSLNPQVPPALEAALLRALEKDPDRRYQTAEEMAEALGRVQAQIKRQQAEAQLQQMLAVQAASANRYQTIEIQQPDTVSQPAGTIHTVPTQLLTPAAPANARQGWVSRRTILALVLLIGGLIAGLLALNRFSAQKADGAGVVAQQGAVTPTPLYGVVPSEQPSSTTEPLPSTEAALPPTDVPADVPVPASTSRPLQPTAPPVATARPAPAPTRRLPRSTAPPVGAGEAVTVRLDDDVWEGGYGGVTRRRSYGGRTAAWIYGTATEYSTMHAAFEVAAQPVGQVTLTLEGMDSEDTLKTPISITVNGVEIYTGPNPLPNDDKPLESGTWSSYSWSFDAALLQPGENQISISNDARGAFSLPPFFMLDYADITYTGS